MPGALVASGREVRERKLGSGRRLVSRRMGRDSGKACERDVGGHLYAPRQMAETAYTKQNRPQGFRHGAGFVDVKRNVRRNLSHVLAGLATTYSPATIDAVPSALRRFTAEFGMGSGAATSLKSPDQQRRVKKYLDLSFVPVALSRFLHLFRMSLSCHRAFRPAPRRGSRKAQLKLAIMIMRAIKPIELLVLLSSTRYRASTCSLSTW
jgi:hypothetical protein